MKFVRLSAWVASAGAAALLSGCVVAPIGHRPVAVYPHGVYVEPAPVIVVPGPRFHYGYGYRGHPGYRGHHGHRGHHR